MKATFNRHDRRTRGKEIAQRLTTLKNSQILKDADLSELPEDVVTALKEGTCENDILQKRYNLCLKIMAEMIELQMELTAMQNDYKQKLQTSAKNNLVNVKES